jgi:hypothetical protein
MRLPVEVEFSQPFSASDQQAWRAEYERNVLPEVLISTATGLAAATDKPEPDPCKLAAAVERFSIAPDHDSDFQSVLHGLERLNALDRDRFWDELTSRPDLWEGGY